MARTSASSEPDGRPRQRRERCACDQFKPIPVEHGEVALAGPGRAADRRLGKVGLGPKPQWQEKPGAPVPHALGQERQRTGYTDNECLGIPFLAIKGLAPYSLQGGKFRGRGAIDPRGEDRERAPDGRRRPHALAQVAHQPHAHRVGRSAPGPQHGELARNDHALERHAGRAATKRHVKGR